jgi:hypothetical protein
MHLLLFGIYFHNATLIYNHCHHYDSHFLNVLLLRTYLWYHSQSSSLSVYKTMNKNYFKIILKIIGVCIEHTPIIKSFFIIFSF